MHEIRTVDIFGKILHRNYGDRANELIARLESIEELALAIDDICDGVSGVEVARKLVNSLLNLLKFDREILEIISKEGKGVFEENAKIHKIATEIEKASSVTSVLAYLIEGYTARAALAELYSKLSKVSGFTVDEFEVKNIVAAYFVIDDLSDLDEDLKNGSPNFVAALNRNTFLDFQMKRVLLEMVFLHFLEEVSDRTAISGLINTYRMYEERVFTKKEEKTIDRVEEHAVPLLLSES